MAEGIHEMDRVIVQALDKETQFLPPFQGKEYTVHFCHRPNVSIWV